MAFEMPKLPFERTALEPHMSGETIDFHYGKHHKAYCDKLNDLIKDNTKFQNATLEEIMGNSEGPLFNNAAQFWNHTFFWNGLTAAKNSQLKEPMAGLLKTHFVSTEAFKEKFAKTALEQFGSGWAWLVQDASGKLDIVKTSNAENPLRQKQTPLLTIDVWEHAYYIDHRNARAKFVDAFWNIVNWEKVQSLLHK